MNHTIACVAIMYLFSTQYLYCMACNSDLFFIFPMQHSTKTEKTEKELIDSKAQSIAARDQKSAKKYDIKRLLSLAMACNPRLGKQSTAKLMAEGGQQIILQTIFGYMTAERTNQPINICLNCFQTGYDFKRCSRCKIAYYCSQDCQRKDWTRHSRECAQPQQ